MAQNLNCENFQYRGYGYFPENCSRLSNLNGNLKSNIQFWRNFIKRNKLISIKRKILYFFTGFE